MPVKDEAAQYLATLPPFPSAALVDPAVSNRYLAVLRSSRSLQTSPEAVDSVHDVVTEAGLTLRVYRPLIGVDLPVVVFYHGGGWVMGDLDMHDSTCRRFANQGPFVVVSVDYRLAPECRFPGPLDDAYAGLEWVHQNIDHHGGDARRIAVMGTSAGGNLAAAVAIRARDTGGPPLRAQVLIYPVIDSEMATESYREFSRGYLLEQEQMAWFWDQYIPDAADRLNPYASPRHTADLVGLPTALVVTAEYDPLRDEAEEFAHRLGAAGVRVKVERVKGQIHGFLQMLGTWDDADQTAGRIARALSSLF